MNRMPYGAWPSPITPELVVSGARTLSELQVDGDDVLWLEGRPDEDGRYVVVRLGPEGAPEDVTPPGTNSRTRVHEYGGGSYCARNGTVWFAEFTDQRLYRVDPGSDPRPITPEPDQPAGLRYADLEVSPDGAWIICVREVHGDGAEARNEVVAIPADGNGEAVILAGGRDFYHSPRLAPSGDRVALIAWDHPNMPWDGTELTVFELGAGMQPRESVRVAGAPDGDESVILPAWSPDGTLHVVSDRSGWWNLYRWDGSELAVLAPAEVELGQPLWAFGQSLCGFLDDGRIAVVATDRAVERPSLLDPELGTITPLPVSDTAVQSLRTRNGEVGWIGAAADQPQAIRSFAPSTGEASELYLSRDLPVDAAWLPEPEVLAFPTSDGATAHGLLYPPTNPDVTGPPDERPPLIVTSHGGPTSHSPPQLKLAVAFWTSRGFAVVDVNYRGSTGFGREYRRALDGTWGVYDVDDCIAAARFLADRGDVDAERMAIRGGSASGYTTLCALTFHDVFAAGASYYGVSDLALLAEETHKFESRYLDRLVGPYPEAADVYEQRSPIHHTERLATPMILFQGLEDLVVPPSQAEVMVDALRERGVRHAYVTFPDEQHGFRKAENQRRCLEAELSFYGQVLGFEPADDIDPIPLD